MMAMRIVFPVFISSTTRFRCGKSATGEVQDRLRQWRRASLPDAAHAVDRRRDVDHPSELSARDGQTDRLTKAALTLARI